MAYNILYIKTPKTSQDTVRMNKQSSKVIGYKINIQKSAMFLYTDD